MKCMSSAYFFLIRMLIHTNMQVLKQHTGTISIKDLSAKTSIKPEDIRTTLEEHLNLIQMHKGQKVICADPIIIDKYGSDKTYCFWLFIVAIMVCSSLTLLPHAVERVDKASNTRTPLRLLTHAGTSNKPAHQVFLSTLRRLYGRPTTWRGILQITRIDCTSTSP